METILTECDFYNAIEYLVEKLGGENFNMCIYEPDEHRIRIEFTSGTYYHYRDTDTLVKGE